MERSGIAAIKYLSRYLYRGVISKKNIVANKNGRITFKYTESKTGRTRYRTLAGEDFLQLILQHVLPKGFRRVRNYGFLHGNAKKNAAAGTIDPACPARGREPTPAACCLVPLLPETDDYHGIPVTRPGSPDNLCAGYRRGATENRRPSLYEKKRRFENLLTGCGIPASCKN